MDKEQRAALRKVAEEATPVQWVFDAEDNHISSDGRNTIAQPRSGHSISAEQRDRNGNHIAAANPSTMLQLLDYIETLEKDAAHKQARIDALMLEFCQEEMTKEQMAEWARHQVPAQHRLICKRCGVDRFVSPCTENGVLCPVIGTAAMQGETE